MSSPLVGGYIVADVPLRLPSSLTIGSRGFRLTEDWRGEEAPSAYRWQFELDCDSGLDHKEMYEEAEDLLNEENMTHRPREQ